MDTLFKYASGVALALFAVGLSSCSKTENVAGGVTDIGNSVANGYVVTEGNQPVARARVVAYYDNWDKTSIEDSVVVEADDNGMFSLKFDSTRSVVLYAEGADGTGLSRMQGNANALVMVGHPRRLESSIAAANSGYMRIVGSSEMAPVNEDGSFEVVRSGEKAAGQVSGFLGNFGVILRAYAYILMLGRQNVKLVGKYATLGANYIKESLKDCYKLPIPSVCKHEFVFDGLVDDGSRKAADGVEERAGATTLDVAKRLLDFGFHAPTIYFPLLFHQAIMIEPTETESLETLDAFIEVMRKIAAEAAEDPAILKGAPHNAPITRPDETTAARQPVLKFQDEA